MNDDKESTSARGDKAANLRDVRTRYFIFLAGFFLVFGPHQATIILQSSINVQGDIGTSAVGTAYAVSVFVALFITPIAVRRIGVRWVFVLGQVTYLLYISANFYPEKWLMIGVGIILGVGEGMVWTAIPIYLWFFGFRHSNIGRKQSTFYVRKYTAIFFSSAQLAQIFGSSISYGILYGIMGKNETSATVDRDLAKNSSSTFETQFEHCGARDCLDSNVTSANLNKFVPANTTSLLILILIFCVMCICGLMLPICFLPQPTTLHRMETENQDVLVDENENKEPMPEKTRSLRSTLRATLRHVTALRQLLLVPISIYEGLIGSFIYSQASRSFGSCILGVEKLGLVIVAYSTVNGLASAASPKVIGMFRRRKVMVALLVLDIFNYTFCLLWRPTEGTKYLLFITFTCFAVSYSLWTNCVFDGYTAYFELNQEISYTVWNALHTSGLAIGFLWTPLLCVNVKLYIHIALVIFSTVCFGIAEYVQSGSSDATGQSK